MKQAHLVCISPPFRRQQRTLGHSKSNSTPLLLLDHPSSQETLAKSPRLYLLPSKVTPPAAKGRNRRSPRRDEMGALDWGKTRIARSCLPAHHFNPLLPTFFNVCALPFVQNSAWTKRRNGCGPSVQLYRYLGSDSALVYVWR